MQIKYTNRLSFLTISEENKIRYCTKGNRLTHTHTQNWNPGMPHVNAHQPQCFNIYPGETFNILLILVQYHVQILAQQYFYIVFKISSAVRSPTSNTTQSTSLLKLYTISLCLCSKKVLHVNKRQTEMHITLPIPTILLPLK